MHAYIVSLACMFVKEREKVFIMSTFHHFCYAFRSLFTAPLLWNVWLRLLLEDFLRDPDGRHRFWPPGVKGQVGDDLDEFGLREAVLFALFRWPRSCSMFPPAISAATVTRLPSPSE